MDENEHYEDLVEAPGLPTIGDIVRWREIAAKTRPGSTWELVGIKVVSGEKIMGIFRKPKGT
jgi:hypothetical protein